MRNFSSVAMSVCALFFCILLSSCGIPEVKTEDDILSDITSNDTFFADYDLSVDEKSVTDRMVDEEAKTESMTVSVRASNQDFAYSVQYVLTYSVKEDAWVLSNFEKTSEEYTAQALATKEEADVVLREKYDTYSYISQDGEGNECEFLYTASKAGGDVTIDYEVTLPFTFSPDGWNAGTVHEEETEYSGTCGENLSWTADSSGTLSISGSGKVMADYSPESPAPWGKLPEKFAVKSARVDARVEHLGSNAFADCPQLTSISLPETVISAGDEAFSGCTGLKEISFAGSRARWEAHMSGTLAEESKAKILTAKNSAEIIDFGKCGEQVGWTLDSEGVLTIAGTGAIDDFQPYVQTYEAEPTHPWLKYCREESKNHILQVVIEEGVSHVGQGAFMRLQELTKATIPNTVTSIGHSAFADCHSLTEVNIPVGVQDIEDCVFYNCSSLVNLNLPDTVTRIGGFAFYNCSSFSSLSLPATVKIIESFAFCKCDGLTTLKLSDGITIIEADAFAQCANLATVSLPNTLQELQINVFKDCTNMTELHLPAYIERMPGNSFGTMEKIQNIYINGTEKEWSAGIKNFMQISSEDYTVHFSDGSTFHYYLHSPTLSKEDAGRNACDFFGLSYDSLIETLGQGAEIEADESVIEGSDGHVFYVFHHWKWILSPGGIVPNRRSIAEVYVDAETGECYSELP